MKRINFNLVTLVMIIAWALLAYPTIAGNKLQAGTDAEAHKKAETEYNALSKRGWAVKEGSLRDALVQNWEKRLVKDENGLNVYMIAYGNATSSSLEEAEADALQKAREQISGPMVMYFQSWNMAAGSKGDISEEEATAIRNAVNASEHAIRQAFIDLAIPPNLNMHREQRRGYEVHIRIVHPQPELRQMAMEIIAAELERSAGWDQEKSFRLMTYEK